MRFSIVIALILFVAFSLYLGWEQGAFSFKKMRKQTHVTQQTGYDFNTPFQQKQSLKSAGQRLMNIPKS